LFELVLHPIHSFSAIGVLSRMGVGMNAVVVGSDGAVVMVKERTGVDGGLWQ
jgi:hypothetical protein